MGSPNLSENLSFTDGTDQLSDLIHIKQVLTYYLFSFILLLLLYIPLLYYFIYLHSHQIGTDILFICICSKIKAILFQSSFLAVK